MTSIDDDLLTRYVARACTPLERARVDRWIDASPDRAALVAALRDVATDTGGLTPERKRAMLAAIKRSSAAMTASAERATASLDAVRGDEPTPRTFALRKPSRWSPVSFRVAAVLAILVGAAAGGRWAFAPRARSLSSSSTTGLRSFATAPGQRLVFRLPDGTAVALAPASVLRLAADYGTRNRTVDLEGEAAFTVNHDAARPFVVRTARGAARDVGTRFVVRAYPADPAAEVVVAEGLVAFRPDTVAVPRGDSVLLARGARVRITSEGRVTLSRGVDLDPYFAWTAGRLVFRDTPLREAVARMSRWYDVDVRVASPSVGDRLLSATFDADTAADVLPLVAASLKLELTQSGRVYTFDAK